MIEYNDSADSLYASAFMDICTYARAAGASLSLAEDIAHQIMAEFKGHSDSAAFRIQLMERVEELVNG